MKRNVLTPMGMLLVMVVVLFACKKEDAPIKEPVITDSFTYTVDGANQTATSLYSQNGQSNQVTLNGQNDAYRAILYIDTTLDAGTYVVDNASSEASFNLVPDGMSLSFKMVGGQVTISKHDKEANRVEGTFSGKCYDYPSSPTDSVIISNGSFKLNY